MAHIRLKNIKKGQVFYESHYGQDVEMTATEDCRLEDDENAAGNKSYKLKVTLENGAIEIMEAVDCGGYSLRLDTEPQYYNPKIHKF